MTRRLAIPVGITATGQFYPDRIVTNEDLSRMVDTSNEWILSRTGIRHRRWVEPGTGSSQLGAAALEMALARRGIHPFAIPASIPSALKQIRATGFPGVVPDALS